PAHRIPTRSVAGTGVADHRQRTARGRRARRDAPGRAGRTHHAARATRLAEPATAGSPRPAPRRRTGHSHAASAHLPLGPAGPGAPGGSRMSLIRLEDVTLTYGDSLSGAMAPEPTLRD